MTEDIEQATVDCIVAFRVDALRHDASPLKVWGQLGERVKMASMLARDPKEWASMVQSKLRIENISPASASAQVRLSQLVDRPRPWLLWAFDNHAFLMASARLEAESRKKAKKELQAEIDAVNAAEE